MKNLTELAAGQNSGRPPSSILSLRTPAGMSRRQARRFRRATDVRTPWWHRARAIVVLVIMVVVLGLTLAALAGAMITVGTLVVDRVMS